MLTVYHGSTCCIEEPLAGVCRPNLDFRIGFYATDLKEQAVRWAPRIAEVCHKDEAWLSVYSSDMDVCRILPYHYLCFEVYDAGWLDSVVAYRQDRDLQPAYDMIEGGITDDRVIRTIDLHVHGNYTRERALARLTHQGPNDQIYIINQGIIDCCLCFTETFLLPKTLAPLVVPGTADTVMQGRHRGVIGLLASRLRISADRASDLFHNSDTYRYLTLRNGDLFLKSDLYILDKIIREPQGKWGQCLNLYAALFIQKDTYRRIYGGVVTLLRKLLSIVLRYCLYPCFIAFLSSKKQVCILHSTAANDYSLSPDIYSPPPNEHSLSLNEVYIRQYGSLHRVQETFVPVCPGFCPRGLDEESQIFAWMFAGFMGNSVLCTESLEWRLGGLVFAERALRDTVPFFEIPSFVPGNNNNRRLRLL